MPNSCTKEFDALIVGSGAAGLSLALRLADAGKFVGILSKGLLPSGSTLYAQGGISAVLDEADSTESHVADTLKAGVGLCHEDAVRFTVEHGADCIRWLTDRGVEFTVIDSDSSQPFHLTKEGGHSHRRVVHAADETGKAVENTLVARVLEAGVTILEHHAAIDLITSDKLNSRGNTQNRCLGIYALDTHTGVIKTLPAKSVVLATGGANSAYLYSSNPHTASGDGIAMAWRAGCSIANMEFMQFHPTCLYHNDARSFLISESMRGEGALLRLPTGERFMDQFDERAELAPRDVVARAIDHEMKRLGLDHLLLDVSHRSPDFIRNLFPAIYARCKSLGFDITTDPIPVVPAAHYTCGGIVTDLRGRTTLSCLYAIGENAFTGLHGANRMASNSLLECFAFAAATAEDLIAEMPDSAQIPLPDWDETRVTNSDEEVVVSHNWQEIRRFMWDYVGIVRTNKRLQRAQRRIRMLRTEIDEYYSNFRITLDLIELRNLATCSQLIIDSALQRKESRGLHYNLDFPERLEVAKDTVLIPGQELPQADSFQRNCA